MSEGSGPRAERSLLVPPEAAETRLDAFLTAATDDRSRSAIHTDIKEGRVLVDGRRRPKSYRLRGGETVTHRPVDPPAMTAAPQDIPLTIVYQDDDILVVDKAPGMVVHPAAGHPDGTLVNALLHHLGRAPAGDDPLRPGIVHRLDRDTSGLLAVAVSDRARLSLAAQLADHSMGRTYLTLSWGRWPDQEGTLTGDIGRDPRQRQRMAVVNRGGRAAVTRYRVMEDFGFMQLCRVELETGRTHQIRVHFAHQHHPVVKDPLYGDDGRARGVHGLDRKLAGQIVSRAPRLMLHAAELRLLHPADGRLMVFHAPLPLDMAGVLGLLGSRVSGDPRAWPDWSEA